MPQVIRPEGVSAVLDDSPGVSMKIVIAEKPSVARQIADVVGARTRHDGFLEGGGFRVTWALGHLVTLKDPDEYNPALKRWTLETLPILPDPFLLKQTGDQGAQKQFQVIANLVSGASELICATDAGREGELIFRYILQKIQGTKKRPVCDKITRLWLSSLTEDSIQRAFQMRRPLKEYDNLYAAARCRSEADWIVGMNATRNYTVRFGQSGILWSVGRVQTPVLALLCRRDEEIQHFQPVPWFELCTRYRNIVFKRASGRFSEENDALTSLAPLQGQPFVIGKIAAKCEKILPPQLFDLTALQRDMNARYGLSAADTLQHAQTLYESKAITYPRTDSCYLPREMQSEVRASLEKLRGSWARHIDALDLENLPVNRRIYDDSRVSDHHAILATGNPPRASGPGASLTRVYEAIVTRMIAVFYPPCLKDITTVEGSVEKTLFRARGVVIKDPGWTVLYPTKKVSDSVGKSVKKGATPEEVELPLFVEGESGPHEPFIKKGETKAPKAHTEASLLGMMETAGRLVDDEALKMALRERGLGTPATRAATIETLLQRGYVERQGKELRVTSTGFYLIALLFDPRLKSAELTGDWEGKLRKIERGQLASELFMEEVRQFTREVILDSHPRQAENDLLGKCPRCGSEILEGARGYGCKSWKEGCSYILWKSYKGHTIEREQAARLLQRHIDMQPVQLDSIPRILYLNESGQLGDLALPQSSKSRVAASKMAPTASALAKTNAASKVSGAKEFLCPTCARPIVDRPQAFSCSEWKQGCAFVIWKTIAGKKISLALAKTLASGKESQVLKGFKSKAGKKFDARLKLDNGKVIFLFDS